MSLTPDHRHAFHRWLLEHDLQPEVADAILQTMPPFDWTNIARRDEALAMQSDIDGLRTSVDGLRTDVDGLRTDVDGLRTDVDGLRTDVDGMREDMSAMRVDLNRLSDSMVTRTEFSERLGAATDTLNLRIDTLYNAMLWGFASMMVGFVGVILSVFLAA